MLMQAQRAGVGIVNNPFAAWLVPRPTWFTPEKARYPLFM
jgi:hypothetical protein